MLPDFRSAGGRAHRRRGLIPVLAAMFLISFTLTGLGFAIAWKMESDRRISRRHDTAAGAHVDGLGRAVPDGHGARLVKAIMWANPMTYSVALLNAHAAACRMPTRARWRAWW